MAPELSGNSSAFMSFITRSAAAQGRHERALQGGDRGAVRFECLVEAASWFSSKDIGSDRSDADNGQTTILMASSRKRDFSKVQKLSDTIQTNSSLDDHSMEDDQHRIARAKLDESLNSTPLLDDSTMQRAFPQRATNRIQRISQSILSLMVHNQRSGLASSLEPNLRAQLGDSPDTSKALRSLVMAGLVQREGRGGRSDTFRYKVPQCQWERLGLAGATFTHVTSAIPDRPVLTTPVNATDPMLPLPPAQSRPFTASNAMSRAGSEASPLCGSTLTHSQDLASTPLRPRADSGLSLTQGRAASGGARSAGSIYSQGSVVLCDTTNAGRPTPCHTNFYMPPAKAACHSGIASLAASGLLRAGRSSGESGAQGSHAPPASDCDPGAHWALLKAVPRSWGQENAPSFGSQASLLRVALATPQMPPPLFLSASQEEYSYGRQGPQRSVGAPLTNTISGPPSSASLRPHFNSTRTSGDATAMLGEWLLHNVHQRENHELFCSALSERPLQPLPSGEGVQQPPPAPTAADASPFATSRKGALLEWGPSDYAHLVAREQ